MPPACRACTHEDRNAIDAAIVGGESSGKVARRYGLSDAGISRHRKRHLSPAIAKVDAQRGGRLHNRVEGLLNRTEAILNTAEETGRVAQALAAIREMRGLLELLGKATGELDDKPTLTVNLMASPEWMRIRGAVLDALALHPEARADVAARLAALDAVPMANDMAPRLVGSSLGSVGERAVR